MKPYYEHGGIRIFHGDCREILPQISADVLITDPPYGIGLENHSMGKDRRDEDFTIRGDGDQELGLQAIRWADERNYPVAVFASPWKPWPGEWRNLLVWDKGPAVGGGGDTSLCFKRTWELIQMNRNGKLQRGRDSSVLTYWITPQDTSLHIAAKPVKLIEYLIRQITTDWNIVCDPFMGSGSTLIAAKNTMREAIGIEIEEKYCEIAAKRLSQEVLQFEEKL